MIITVTGGSSTGKSAMAEDLAMQLEPGKKYYIATMIRTGEAEDPIIGRHRVLREGKSFVTVECFHHPELAQVPAEDAVHDCAGSVEPSGNAVPLPADSMVLLEDVANLLANEMFAPESVPGADNMDGMVKNGNAAEEVMIRIRKLAGNCRNLILVTNEVFSDGILYEESTAAYIRALGDVNRELMRLSDVYVESVYGIPKYYKGAELL